MAQASTSYRFALQVNDVDRGVDALVATLDRSNAWKVLRSNRHRYVTVSGRTLGTVFVVSRLLVKAS